jgi:spore germination protein GerM
MKPRRKKKSRGKNQIEKIFLFLILIGIGFSMAYFFRQEIFKTLKPWFERKGIVREKKVITLYFSDQEGEYLIGEKRTILKRDEAKEEAKEAVIELIKGPKGKLIPTLPSRTKLLSLQLDQAKVAKVNFNQALIKDHPGGSSAEMMSIYSIVNSLTLNFSQIKRVQILVEGKEIETIAGHLALKKPVSPNPGLIKRQ